MKVTSKHELYAEHSEYSKKAAHAKTLARDNFSDVSNNISIDGLNVIRFFVKFCLY